jgi:hypothetical protein
MAVWIILIGLVIFLIMIRATANTGGGCFSYILLFFFCGGLTVAALCAISLVVSVIA